MSVSQPIPGTTVPAGSQVSPGGPLGTGINAFNETASQFTVPPVGSTVVVNLNDASWVVAGQIVYVDQAGGGPGSPGILQVTVKNGNQLTLLNPQPPPTIPLANSSTSGLMAILSGLSSDYVGGDNASHNLVTALAGFIIPTGTVTDFAGGTAPSGFVLCDGTSYPTAGAMANLFAVIKYTYGGSGNSFNVPDLRGRSSIGVGQGSGLTSRALAATGGEETHALTVAEEAVHSHGMDHYHNWSAQGSHTHGVNDPGHYHVFSADQWSGTVNVWGSLAGSARQLVNYNTQGAYTNISIQAAATPAGNTQYASTTNSAWANTANAGSGTGHNNMQPFMALNKIIKT
jgi:microcystin-dependent protein